MATRGAIVFLSLVGFSRAVAQSAGGESPAPSPALDSDPPGAWLFPVERLNNALPRWLRFGGEYRLRFEGEDGIGHTTTNDTYLLGRLRFNTKIQPVKWLTFFGETQDSRIFFFGAREKSPYFARQK